MQSAGAQARNPADLGKNTRKPPQKHAAIDGAQSPPREDTQTRARTAAFVSLYLSIADCTSGSRFGFPGSSVSGMTYRSFTCSSTSRCCGHTGGWTDGRTRGGGDE